MAGGRLGGGRSGRLAGSGPRRAGRLGGGWSSRLDGGRSGWLGGGRSGSRRLGRGGAGPHRGGGGLRRLGRLGPGGRHVPDLQALLGPLPFLFVQLIGALFGPLVTALFLGRLGLDPALGRGGPLHIHRGGRSGAGGPLHLSAGAHRRYRASLHRLPLAIQGAPPLAGPATVKSPSLIVAFAPWPLSGNVLRLSEGLALLNLGWIYFPFTQLLLSLFGPGFLFRRGLLSLGLGP